MNLDITDFLVLETTRLSLVTLLTNDFNPHQTICKQLNAFRDKTPFQ